MKKSTYKKINTVGGIIVLLLLIVLILYKCGIVGSLTADVVKIAENTGDKTDYYYADMTEFSENMDYHDDITFGWNEGEFDFSYDCKDKVSQLSFESQVGISFVSADISVIAQMENGGLRLSIPSLGDNIYYYSNFNNEQTKFIEQMSSLSLGVALKEKLPQILSEYRFLEADSEKFEVDGKEEECQAYATKLSEKETLQIYKDLIAGFNDNELDFYDKLHGAGLANELSAQIEKMGESRLTVYAYENVISHMRLESEEGAGTIDIALDVISNTENVSLAIDEEQLIGWSYSVEEKKLRIMPGSSQDNYLEMSFEKDDSSKTLKINGADSVAYITGDISSFYEKIKSNILLNSLISKIDVDDNLSISIKIRDKANIESLQGDTINVDSNGAFTIFEVLNDVISNLI